MMMIRYRGAQRRRTFRWSQVVFLAAAGALLLAARTTSAQSCSDCDQCMSNCVCQADGSCAGTPAQNGTPCDTGNPCTTGDNCQNGECVAGTNKPDTTPCSFPGLGLCIRNAVCQSIPVPGFPSFCAPMNPDDIVNCPMGADKCHPDICNPDTGQCVALDVAAFCAFNPCGTGACDPATGGCVPGHEGDPCDDANVCTTNDRCHSGNCVGTTGGGSSCTGDCNSNNVVTVDEVLLMVNIALGSSDVSLCSRGDADHSGTITVDEILAAVNFALTSCPAA